jgi:hypothetical protein
LAHFVTWRVTSVRPNKKGAQENTGLATALQAAKQEAVELRQRCRHLESIALVAATGQVGNHTSRHPPRFGTFTTSSTAIRALLLGV